MTKAEWAAMLDRISVHAPELIAMSKKYRGPGEACVAFLLAARTCAEMIPGFDVVEAFRKLDEYLKASEGN